MMRLAFLAPAMLAGAAPAHVRAQDLATAAIGTRISGTATVGKHLIPLPPGDFELVARSLSKFQSASGGYGDSGTRADVYLVSTVAGRLDAAVWGTVNLSYNQRWARPRPSGASRRTPDGQPPLQRSRNGQR